MYSDATPPTANAMGTDDTYVDLRKSHGQETRGSAQESYKDETPSRMYM